MALPQRDQSLTRFLACFKKPTSRLVMPIAPSWIVSFFLEKHISRYYRLVIYYVCARLCQCFGFYNSVWVCMQGPTRGDWKDASSTPWAQFGGGHGWRVPPLFRRGGHNMPCPLIFFSLDFVFGEVSNTKVMFVTFCVKSFSC